MLASISYDRTLAIWNIGLDGLLELVFREDLPSLVWARSMAFLGEQSLVFGAFGTSYVELGLATRTWKTSHVGPIPGLNAVVSTVRGVYSIGDSGKVFLDGELSQTLPSSCNFLIDTGYSVLTGGQSGELFDGNTGEVLYQHRSPLNCACLLKSKDFMRILVGTYTGEVLLFELSEFGHPQFVKVVPLFDNAVKGLASDSERVCAVCATGDVLLMNSSSLSLVDDRIRRHEKIVNGCVALHKGRFASISRDKTLRIWDGEGMQLVETPHTHSIKCLAVCPDGRWIATGSYNGAVAVYDLTTHGWQRMKRLTDFGISSINFCRFSNAFVASAYDGSIHRVPIHPATI